MVMVRQAGAADWQALRDIRLEALRDAPDAFGSTHEREAVFGEADWRRRISRGGNFLGYLPEASASEPAGLIGGYQEEPETVELVSMYVRPRARGRGVGEALMATVIDWAAAEVSGVRVQAGPNSARTPSSRTGRLLVNRPSASSAARSMTGASELGEGSVTPCVCVMKGA